jgi:hypothetical protein
MSSSSSSGYPDQYWYPGTQGFRDASDLTLFKKQLGIVQVAGQPVRPPILQSLQNRTSFQFGLLNCVSVCVNGGFPRNSRL